jgi:hypothetical protein
MQAKDCVSTTAGGLLGHQGKCFSSGLGGPWVQGHVEITKACDGKKPSACCLNPWLEW